jgi:hypothetical protein
MSDVVSVLLLRAEEDLASARYDLAGGFIRAALNRAYYAAFHAVQAALLTVGEAPRTHSGVRTRFDLHFIATGKLIGTAGESWSRAKPCATRPTMKPSPCLMPMVLQTCCAMSPGSCKPSRNKWLIRGTVPEDDGGEEFEQKCRLSVSATGGVIQMILAFTKNSKNNT